MSVFDKDYLDSWIRRGRERVLLWVIIIIVVILVITKG